MVVFKRYVARLEHRDFPLCITTKDARNVRMANKENRKTCPLKICRGIGLCKDIIERIGLNEIAVRRERMFKLGRIRKVTQEGKLLFRKCRAMTRNRICRKVNKVIRTHAP